MTTVKTPLVKFLTRHPWTSEGQLAVIFGKPELVVLLESANGDLQYADVPEIGRCFASIDEPEGGLVSLRRLYMVRNYILSVMGPEAMKNGFSPTPVADAECYWDERWWRIWGDLGFAAPEALRFVQHPPVSYGLSVKDIIVVPSTHRMASVAYLVARAWGGTQDLFVWVSGTEYHQVVTPVSIAKCQKWEPYTPDILQSWFSVRRNKDRMFSENGVTSPLVDYQNWKVKNQYRRAGAGNWYVEYKNNIRNKNRHSEFPAAEKYLPDSLGVIASFMEDDDWRLLIFIGDNPTLSQWEISHALGIDVHYGPCGLNKYNSPIPTVERITSLYIKLKLLGLVYEYQQDDGSKPKTDRAIPNEKAIKMLMESWGVEPEDFQQFHPWPQVISGVRSVMYSTGWLKKMNPHQTLCRQFALAMTLGGRSVSNGYGRVDTNIISTVGSRFTYTDEIDGNNKLEWISPDGYLQTTVFSNTKVNEGGREAGVAQSDLLVEIDRATNSFPRLAERIEKYKTLLPAMAHENPVLVWVTLGTENREEFLLSEMRKAGIVGYVVSHKRLVIKAEDPWWLVNPTALPFKAEYAAVGGMAPFRNVWRCTETGDQLGPILGKNTWALKLEIHEGRPPEYSKIYRQY